MTIAHANSAKLYYLAIFEKGADGYYVHFPDVPGCISAGDTLQAAAVNAEVALALHASGTAEDNGFLEFPTAGVDYPRDPDVEEVARLLVGLDLEAAEKARINIMMDRNLIAAIDRISDNRSRFISDAARSKLRELAA